MPPRVLIYWIIADSLDYWFLGHCRFLGEGDCSKMFFRTAFKLLDAVALDTLRRAAVCSMDFLSKAGSNLQAPEVIVNGFEKTTLPFSL
jgi:hypothetical protein